MRRKMVLSGKNFILFALIAIAAVLLLRFAGESMKSGTRVESAADIVSFLAGYGWEVNPEPVNVKSVEIPKTFSEVYEQYNGLQKSQGYDLTKYKGKTADSYSFEILNFDGMPGVFANVLVVDGKIAGGDICSYAMDGFMVGFSGK